MLPVPLHPAVVHFPIALVVLLPLFALGALVAIRRGASAVAMWALPVAVAGALTASAWLAVRTGEAEEDRVEEVVGKSEIHAHEEAAERFLALAGALFLVAGAGLVPGTIGASARLAATAGAIGLVFAGVRVGASGGDLVYEHGAASAYSAVIVTDSGAARSGMPAATGRRADPESATH